MGKVFSKHMQEGDSATHFVKTMYFYCTTCIDHYNAVTIYNISV